MSKEKKYNIKVTKKREDSKLAESHKDFDKVYSAYSSWIYRHPWYKAQLHMPRYRKTLMFIILIVLLSYLVWEASEEERQMELERMEQTDPNIN